MQEHIWVVQVYNYVMKSWVYFGAKPTRSNARSLQRTSTLPTRIRKYIAA